MMAIQNKGEFLICPDCGIEQTSKIESFLDHPQAYGEPTDTCEFCDALFTVTPIQVNETYKVESFQADRKSVV